MLTVGRAIKIIREAKHVRLGELAKQAGISVPYLSLLESNEREPSLGVLGRLAEALEVPSDVFLLIGQTNKTSLRTNSKRAGNLIDSLRAMAEIEKTLQERLQT